MREEQYWQEEAHQEFYFFWEEYHFGANADICEDKQVYAYCSDFQMMSDDECAINVQYNTCNDESFVCESWSYNPTTQTDEMTDCAEDFTDFFFWSAMREEAWWTMNEQHMDFYMFWENYHFGSSDDYSTGDYDDWGTGDYDDWGNDDWGNDDWGNWDDYSNPDECQWTDLLVQCSDFVMFEGDNCEVSISYNPCDDSQFFCNHFGINEYGEHENTDCTEDFMDSEFWAMLSQEEWWYRDENQQYMDFYMYWNNYHMTVDPCEWKDIFATCNDFDFA
jgi:hypothetical protein